MGVLLTEENPYPSTELNKIWQFLQKRFGKEIHLNYSPSESRVSAELPSSWQKEILSIVQPEYNTRKIPLGIMFINYRRHHQFSSDEKQMIDTLATSAAIVLKKLDWSNEKRVLLSDEIWDELLKIDQKSQNNSLSTSLGEAIGTYAFILDEMQKLDQTLWLKKGETYTQLVFKRQSGDDHGSR